MAGGFGLVRGNSLKAPPRFELGVEVLQTSALPLGYGADVGGSRLGRVVLVERALTYPSPRQRARTLTSP